MICMIIGFPSRHSHGPSPKPNRFLNQSRAFEWTLKPILVSWSMTLPPVPWSILMPRPNHKIHLITKKHTNKSAKCKFVDGREPVCHAATQESWKSSWFNWMVYPCLVWAKGCDHWNPASSSGCIPQNWPRIKSGTDPNHSWIHVLTHLACRSFCKHPQKTQAYKYHENRNQRTGVSNGSNMIRVSSNFPKHEFVHVSISLQLKRFGPLDFILQPFLNRVFQAKTSHPTGFNPATFPEQHSHFLLASIIYHMPGHLLVFNFIYGVQFYGGKILGTSFFCA